MLDTLFLTDFPDPAQRQIAIQNFITANALPPTLLSSVDFLTNQVTLSKRLGASVVIRGMRGTLLVNAFRDDRRNQTTGVEVITGTDPFALSERVVQTGFSSALSWRFTERTTGVAALAHTRSELTDPGREDINNTLRVGINHQFQPKIRGAVDFRVHERTSSTPGLDTKEHAIVGTLSVTF
jgi:uncharacterized protein (PEP-CTERM system associated)